MQNTGDQPPSFYRGSAPIAPPATSKWPACRAGRPGLSDALRDLKRIGDTPEMVLSMARWIVVHLNARKPVLLTEPARHLANKQQGFLRCGGLEPWETGTLASPTWRPATTKNACIEGRRSTSPSTAAEQDWAGRRTDTSIACRWSAGQSPDQGRFEARPTRRRKMDLKRSVNSHSVMFWQWTNATRF